MIFEKFIDADLGHVSYIVACGETREAFIVDPRRDISEYVEFIEINSLKLKYIFNTHTHADYIGGHLELASKYSVDNIFQKDAPIENFKILKVRDFDGFNIGNTLKIKILETPGHTPFDISLLLSENNTEKLLFTGDLLFIGNIGRPDLLGEENLDLLIHKSYESAKKLWCLGDDIIVLTSHIEGSLCGKNLSLHYFSTIGIEKKTNTSFSLCMESEEKYRLNLISQKIETPAFFKKMASININGPKLIHDIVREIHNVEFDDICALSNLQIIDLREPNKFHKNHITGSINISAQANVSLIAGSLLSYEKDTYIIGNSNIDGFITKLLRVGLDNIKGIINGDFSLIESVYLSTTNTVTKDQITPEFIHIALDYNCSEISNTIQSNISQVRDLDLSTYEKIVFTCKHGFKSSAISSLLTSDKIYFIR